MTYISVSVKLSPAETAYKLILLVGYIDLRFMCGEGFYMACGLRTFVTAGQACDKHFTSMAMSGDGQDIM
jgi:hypothetical protein